MKRYEEFYYTLQDTAGFWCQSDTLWDELLQEIYSDHHPNTVYDYRSKEEVIKIGKKILSIYAQKHAANHPDNEPILFQNFRLGPAQLEVSEEGDQGEGVYIILQMRREFQNVNESRIEIEVDGKTYFRNEKVLGEWHHIDGSDHFTTLFIPLVRNVYYFGE
jgi:hypothetical protein